MKRVLNIRILAITALALNLVVGLGFTLTQTSASVDSSEKDTESAEQQAMPSLALLVETEHHRDETTSTVAEHDTASGSHQPVLGHSDSHQTDAHQIAPEVHGVAADMHANGHDTLNNAHANASETTLLPMPHTETETGHGAAIGDLHGHAETDQVDSAHIQSQCFEIGPIHQQAATDQLMKELKAMHLAVAITRQDPGELLGHWVYLRPERSLALARLKLEELKLKGLSDVALVREAEPLNAISLGVYRNKLTAQKRKKQIQKMGYEPELALRYKRQPETWLFVEATADNQPTEAGWKVLLAEIKNAEFKPNDC